MLLGQLGHLVCVQAGVGKHADLAGDVAPVVLAAELLQVLLEESAHGDNAVSQLLHLAGPLLVESGVVENLRGDTGTVDGGAGVKRSDEDLDLRIDALLLFLGRSDNGECTGTLAIKTLVISVSNFSTVLLLAA